MIQTAISCLKDHHFPPPDDLSPFETRPQFDLADLLFRKNQMSGSNINELLQIWTSTLLPEEDPPFISKDHLYNTIDAIELGEVPWNLFSVSFNGDIPEGDTATWKRSSFHVYFQDPRTVLHNQLGNPDFATEMDTAPKEVHDESGTRRYTDLMSADWSWRQAVIFFFFYISVCAKLTFSFSKDEIAKDPSTHGTTFCPIILGSDKTTVSVATGQNDYYPLYMSNGLDHNNVRRAHCNALTLIAFLAIPKGFYRSYYY